MTDQKPRPHNQKESESSKVPAHKSELDLQPIGPPNAFVRDGELLNVSKKSNC